MRPRSRASTSAQIIHAPAWVRPGLDRARIPGRVSIHTRVVRPQSGAVSSYPVGFNSRTRVGCDKATGHPRVVRPPDHAFRVGCDGRLVGLTATPYRFTTHPRGCDFRSSSVNEPSRSIHAPRGVRPATETPRSLYKSFQFTHPKWGATVSGYSSAQPLFQFTH